MSTARDRMRELRRRQAQGLAVLAVEVPIDRLALALGEDGFLREWDDTDRDAIAGALERMISAYCTSVLGE